MFTAHLDIKFSEMTTKYQKLITANCTFSFFKSGCWVDEAKKYLNSSAGLRLKGSDQQNILLPGHLLRWKKTKTLNVRDNFFCFVHKSQFAVVSIYLWGSFIRILVYHWVFWFDKHFKQTAYWNSLHVVKLTTQPVYLVIELFPQEKALIPILK